MADIEASRVVHNAPSSLPEKPVHDADPLFPLHEAGDHHVTILDGDRFEPLWRFRRASRCTAAPSTRRTAASSTSARATAGSASTTSGAEAGGRGARRHQFAQHRQSPPTAAG